MPSAIKFKRSDDFIFLCAINFTDIKKLLDDFDINRTEGCSSRKIKSFPKNKLLRRMDSFIWNIFGNCIHIPQGFECSYGMSAEAKIFNVVR